MFKKSFTYFRLPFLAIVISLVSCKNETSDYVTAQNYTAETTTFPSDSLAIQFAMKGMESRLPDSLDAAMVRYGYNILTNTSKYVGPDVADTSMRYAGNNLACVNCHIAGGTKAYAGSWIGVMDRYPTFRSKNGKINDIHMRVDGCFKRSMNGIPLPKDSKEMGAIVEYFKWLSTDTLVNKMPQYKGFLKIDLPHRAADTVRGKRLFNSYCYICHGTDGKGVLFDKNNLAEGYLYPQLWGEDTYNIGAGMAKLGSFAGFIKANMPYGVEFDKPHLTDEEAYDIAGYVNMQYRPTPPHLDDDYPDKSKKGVDVPYGPYDDPFPEIQHRIGPFQPIDDYYKLRKENEPDVQSKTKDTKLTSSKK